MDGRLWYRTGDIVSIDKDVYLYFVDRTVDTIKHKGYRVCLGDRGRSPRAPCRARILCCGGA